MLVSHAASQPHDAHDTLMLSSIVVNPCQVGARKLIHSCGNGGDDVAEAAVAAYADDAFNCMLLMFVRQSRISLPIICTEI